MGRLRRLRADLTSSRDISVADTQLASRRADINLRTRPVGRPERATMSMSLPTSEAWPQLATATSVLSRAPEHALALLTPKGEHLLLRDELTIGQAPGNVLVLEDTCASRRHCVIERFSGGFRVRDLESKNGTFVNDVRVAEAPLAQGSYLGVGRSRMRVIVEPKLRSPLVGESGVMRALRQRISRVAPTGLPVLIVGETGTGKELVARALHDLGGRGGAFVALNCGAIAAELVESELFGHEKGAFTGATQRRLGVFQEADGGTLFLDEIGELSPSLQPRLLRALEVGAVRPVGATRELRVQVRVVAATHVDLEAAVARGAFREDLYYRLCGDLVRTPPLREHPQDIPELAQRILGDESASAILDESALSALCEYAWPGNVRELRNALRRAAALSGPRIYAADLSLTGRSMQRTTPEGLSIDGRPFLDLEREILARALSRAGGNKRAAAHALGIPKSTLCDKAKRYKLG